MNIPDVRRGAIAVEAAKMVGGLALGKSEGQLLLLNIVCSPYRSEIRFPWVFSPFLSLSFSCLRNGIGNVEPRTGRTGCRPSGDFVTG